MIACQWMKNTSTVLGCTCSMWLSVFIITMKYVTHRFHILIVAVVYVTRNFLYWNICILWCWWCASQVTGPKAAHSTSVTKSFANNLPFAFAFWGFVWQHNHFANRRQQTATEPYERRSGSLSGLSGKQYNILCWYSWLRISSVWLTTKMKMHGIGEWIALSTWSIQNISKMK